MLYEHYPQLDARLLSYPGARRDYQPVWMWDRYLVADRMYAGLLYIGAHKDPRYANHPFLSIKIDPRKGSFTAHSTRTRAAGYYSDKRTWVSIRLDGSLPRLNWPPSAAAAMIWWWPNFPGPSGRLRPIRPGEGQLPERNQKEKRNQVSAGWVRRRPGFACPGGVRTAPGRNHSGSPQWGQKAGRSPRTQSRLPWQRGQR